MQKIFDFINKNRLLSIVILAVAFLAIKPLSTGVITTRNVADYGTAPSIGLIKQERGLYEAGDSAMYQFDTSGRKFIQDASLSALVKDVDNTLKAIDEKAQKFGGYTVNRHINTPEFGKTGYISVRVANDKRVEFVEFVKSLAVKIVSENISGYDITDQYTDVEERLRQEEALKTKLQTIMNSTTTVDEMIKVQAELTNVQMRIDNLKGQMKYMADASATTLFTINVSTDELALPYTPANPFRPDVVFKQAVRSVIETLYKVGSLAIWLVVYSVILIPAWFVYKALRKRFTRA